jgi:MFS family permease
MNMTILESSSTQLTALAAPTLPSSQIRDPPCEDAFLSNGQPRQAEPNASYTEPKDIYKASVEETLDERIERIGRERPLSIKSLWHEIGLVFSVAMSQFLTKFFVSSFVVILPTLIKELDISQASSVWPATAFPLVIASTLLTFGRLGDMWGAYPVFMIGLVWFVVWSVICGFIINPLMLDFCRALQGLGAAAFLPTGVQLLGSLYRPGPRKNLVFAIYGTSAIFGFFAGIFVAGVVGQYFRWGFYFWIGSILTAVTLASSFISIPRSPVEKNAMKMDYLGVITITAGLVLTIFAITQSAHASLGWREPYIILSLIIGILFLLAAVEIETSSAADPLLPGSIFTTSCMTPFLVALFLLYDTWGIFSLYRTLYFQDIMSASPLQVVAWFAPLGVAGLLISVLEGFILHLVPGRVLLVIPGLGAVGSQLLLVFVPLGGSYWAWIFPAMVLGTIGLDLSTNLMTVFVTFTFPSSQPGLAGGIINAVLQLGVAFSLGVADIIQTRTVDHDGLAQSYKNTFWLGVGAAALSLFIMVIWGRVPKATSGLTADEKEELMRDAEVEVGIWLASQGATQCERLSFDKI